MDISSGVFCMARATHDNCDRRIDAMAHCVMSEILIEEDATLCDIGIEGRRVLDDLADFQLSWLGRIDLGRQVI